MDKEETEKAKKVRNAKKEYTLDLLLDFGEDGKKLIPVVTQDIDSKDVLILGSTNRQAFQKTLESGYVTYWSKSRNVLWTKGETSGDLLKLVEMRINCDQNSLLYFVEMIGKGACHAKDPSDNAYKSCYYRRIKDGRLEFI